jgi:hypothetical protein
MVKDYHDGHFMINVDALTQFLAPALPILLKVTDKATDGALTKIGEDAWDSVKGLWKKLWPKVEGDPVALAAANKLAAAPENLDRQLVLKMALQDLLDRDPALAQELADLWKAAKPAPTIQVEIKSKGNNNTNVGVNYGTML